MSVGSSVSCSMSSFAIVVIIDSPWSQAEEMVQLPIKRVERNISSFFFSLTSTIISHHPATRCGVTLCSLTLASCIATEQRLFVTHHSASSSGQEPTSRRPEMVRLLTQNLICCPAKSCSYPANFPLSFSSVTDLQIVQAEFNEEFLRGYLNRIEWSALRKSAAEVSYADHVFPPVRAVLPHTLYSEEMPGPWGARVQREGRCNARGKDGKKRIADVRG